MDTITEALREVLEESSLSKAIRQKVEDIILVLEGPGENRLKASKALAELEELSDNAGIPSYIRTQLWNVASMLEAQ